MPIKFSWSDHLQLPPLWYYITAPPVGAATCFANATAAFEAWPAGIRDKLEELEILCSLAHHDAMLRR